MFYVWCARNERERRQGAGEASDLYPEQKPK